MRAATTTTCSHRLTVTITVVDKDTPEVLFENVTANALTIAELANDTAATRTFKVKLATEPTDTVTVTIVDPTDNERHHDDSRDVGVQLRQLARPAKT